MSTRRAPILTVLLLPALLAGSCLGQAFGTWEMNPARSTFSGGTRPKSITVRIERHPKGEVFTFDRIEADGRATSSSTILYLDGSPRDFHGFECSGTQSSRRLDKQTVEIMRNCGSGQWTRLVRRTAADASELIIEFTEQQRDGHRFEWCLVLGRLIGR